jgi:glycine oxidase
VSETADVIIVGGGVIGLSLAWELAGQGRAVRVLEQGQFGREASWAGAGILPPGNRETAATPEARLRAFSHELWPRWSAQLRDETGVDNGFLTCGGIGVQLDGLEAEYQRDVEFWRAERLPIEILSPHELRIIEPAVSSDVLAAYRSRRLAQVRNPRHLKALVAACQRRGVMLHSGERVLDVNVRNGKLAGVATVERTYSAKTVCICGGPWSGELLRRCGVESSIVPVRGQIALLSLKAPLFRHVIECGRRYLVPRPDGRVLIGSTQEYAGFDKRNTAAGISELLQFGTRLVPALADATLERTWAGLRPGTPDGVPYLGPVPGVDGLFIAAGHFRAGLQMSPGTAVVMADVIQGRPLAISLRGFGTPVRGTEWSN